MATRRYTDFHIVHTPALDVRGQPGILLLLSPVSVLYLTPHFASRESCKPDLHLLVHQSFVRYDRNERDTPDRPAIPLPGESRTPVSGYCLAQVLASGAAEVVVALAGTPSLARVFICECVLRKSS